MTFEDRLRSVFAGMDDEADDASSELWAELDHGISNVQVDDDADFSESYRGRALTGTLDYGGQTYEWDLYGDDGRLHVWREGEGSDGDEPVVSVYVFDRPESGIRPVLMDDIDWGTVATQLANAVSQS